MKSAMMDAGILILILVGTAGAEGTAQLSSHLSKQFQKLPETFSLQNFKAAPDNVIRVQTVSNQQNSAVPAAFQPRSAVPITGRQDIRVSSFKPAIADSDSGIQQAVDSTTNTTRSIVSEDAAPSIKFSPPITYSNPRPVVSTASVKSVSTTSYAPVVEIPDNAELAPPVISPAPNTAPAFSGTATYSPTPTPTIEPSYTIPSAGVQVPTTTTTVVPSYAYRPVTTWVEMPKTVYVGRGIIGQPTVYVPQQPVRNFFRFLSP